MLIFSERSPRGTGTAIAVAISALALAGQAEAQPKHPQHHSHLGQTALKAPKPLAIHPHGGCVEAGLSKKFPYVLHGHGNGQIIFNYYKDNGFSPVAAEAQTGNDWAESHYIPTENSASGLGISQWTSTGGRLQRLETLANAEGRSPEDLGVQLQFSCIEYRQTYPQVLRALQSTNSIESATSIVMYQYEGTSSNYTGRLAAAQTMYKWYVSQQNHT